MSTKWRFRLAYTAAILAACGLSGALLYGTYGQRTTSARPQEASPPVTRMASDAALIESANPDTVAALVPQCWKGRPRRCLVRFIANDQLYLFYMEVVKGTWHVVADQNLSSGGNVVPLN